MYAQFETRSPHRHAQRVKPVLELLNQVFLIAAIVAEEHHFGQQKLFDIRYVKEVANVIKQELVAQLSHMFLDQFDVREAPLGHDFLLDVIRLPARLAVALVFLPALQYLPAALIKALSNLNQIRHGIYPKGKTDALTRPTVKV